MGILDMLPSRGADTPAAVARDGDPIRALQADIDRAFSNFWSLVPFPRPQAVLNAFADDGEPDFKVEVRDNSSEVEIIAELPGFDEDDIEVTAGPDSITIRAERQQQREERDATAMVLARSIGVLERTIPLPEGSLPDKAAARFKNGALTVIVPKSAASQSRMKRIEIQAS
ncbi:MAG: Hsp20/alpha crystallin family protein [Devosia sp.]